MRSIFCERLYGPSCSCGRSLSDPSPRTAGSNSFGGAENRESRVRIGDRPQTTDMDLERACPFYRGRIQCVFSADRKVLVLQLPPDTPILAHATRTELHRVGHEMPGSLLGSLGLAENTAGNPNRCVSEDLLAFIRK